MIIWGVLLFLTGFIACEKDTPDPQPGEFKLVKYAAEEVVKSNLTRTYAHYMPWFETPATNGGSWGIHWTMSTSNPNNTDDEDRRDIASHYYPLTGPYASSDKKLIEYHLLLMKYAGIDGVLIDWYGSSDVNDYKKNRENSEALIDALEAVGLDYAIVYEDRTVPEVASKTGANKIEAAQNDMLYMEDNYFGDNNYIRVDGSPLLLVFGPEEFHSPEEWGEVLGILYEAPTFVTLNYSSSQTSPHSSGEYIWVDQGALSSKYSRKDLFDVFIGGAYPGFNDYYGEGGWGSGFDWSIDHKNGATFKANLDKAKQEELDYLQLITWNDYGEGTMIEPTVEFGFTMLEHVQDFTGVDYAAEHLQRIFDLYELRNNLGDSDQKYLDQAFYYLVSLQYNKATALMDSLYSK